METVGCIANSDTDIGPEVPLWDCPCRECWKLEREVVTNDLAHRPGEFPTYAEWRDERTV